MTERLLVLHDRPADFADLLAHRLPDLPIAWATAPDEVGPALRSHGPTVVFSIKQNAFPGPHHVPALRAPSVRWFHVGGSGVDHLGAWDPRRVTVTNSARVLAPFHAETALAALLSLAVGLPRYARQQRDHAWRPHRFRPVAGRTLLVVGVGAVGGELATRARALGMRVVGVRRSGRPHPAVDEVHGLDALPHLLPRADVVSVNVPLTDATRGLIGAAELAATKPGALLLQSSRGPVVDEAALIEALRSGRLGGAWLDVFDTEPLPADHPLWGLDGVLVTPHAADQVDDYARRFAEWFCALWERRARGEALPALTPPGAYSGSPG